MYMFKLVVLDHNIGIIRRERYSGRLINQTVEDARSSQNSENVRHSATIIETTYHCSCHPK